VFNYPDRAIPDLGARGGDLDPKVWKSLVEPDRDTPKYRVRLPADVPQPADLSKKMRTQAASPPPSDANFCCAAASPIVSME